MPLPFPRGRHRQAILRRAVYLVSYVLRHKWHMLLEGRRVGAPLRATLTHDVDKFWPDYLWLWIVRDQMEYCNRLHRIRAPHHWEWWTDGGDPPRARPMPDALRRELLADWWAAHRAQGGHDLSAWYWGLMEEQRNRIGLHPDTRAWVEAQLEAS
jgi:hypothetical protein